MRRRFRRRIEVAAEGPAEPNDVAGDEYPAAGRFAAHDPVAHVEQWLERSPRIEHRRQAVFQRDLRGFLDQILVPPFVPHDELDR